MNLRSLLAGLGWTIVGVGLVFWPLAWVLLEATKPTR